MSQSKFSCTLLVPSVILSIIGLILCFIGVITPSWQVVYARELQQTIQSGLWINCQTRPSGMYTCTYTFSESDYNFYTSAELVNFRTPPFYSWQRKLLYTILVGQFIGVVGLFSFCTSFYQPVARKCGVIYAVLIGISAVMNLTTSVIFTIFAHMVEYRFFHVSVSGIYEKHKGYSFYLHLVGGILLFISLIIAIIHVVIQFKNKQIERVDDYDRDYMHYGKNAFDEYQYYNNPHGNTLQKPPQRYHGYADSFTGSGSWHGSQDFRMHEYDHVPRYNQRY